LSETHVERNGEHLTAHGAEEFRVSQTGSSEDEWLWMLLANQDEQDFKDAGI